MILFSWFVLHDDPSQSSLIKAKALSYSSMSGCNSALQGWSDRTAEDLSDDTYVAVYSDVSVMKDYIGYSVVLKYFSSHFSGAQAFF